MTQVNKITGATTNSVSAPNAEKVDKKVEVKLSSASQTDGKGTQVSSDPNVAVTKNSDGTTTYTYYRPDGTISKEETISCNIEVYQYELEQAKIESKNIMLNAKGEIIKSQTLYDKNGFPTQQKELLLVHGELSYPYGYRITTYTDQTERTEERGFDGKVYQSSERDNETGAIITRNADGEVINRIRQNDGYYEYLDENNNVVMDYIEGTGYVTRYSPEGIVTRHELSTMAGPSSDGEDYDPLNRYFVLGAYEMLNDDVSMFVDGDTGEVMYFAGKEQTDENRIEVVGRDLGHIIFSNGARVSYKPSVEDHEKYEVQRLDDYGNIQSSNPFFKDK